jgi:hypothetical protein
MLIFSLRDELIWKVEDQITKALPPMIGMTRNLVSDMTIDEAWLD